MNGHSEDERRIKDLRLKIIGLGERSQRKSYYPQLQGRIAELERANRALAESEKKYRTLVENVNVGIYQTGPARNQPIIHANPAMAKIFGYNNASELLTVTPEELYDDPNDREALLTLLRSEGEIKDHRVRMKRRDGTEIVCSLTFTAVSGPDGEVQWIDGVVTDITEQEKAEEALRGSQQMLQLVLDNVPDRVFWKDRDLNYIGCNQNAARDAGLLNPSEIVGKNDQELAWRDSADSYRADDQQVIETGISKINFEEMQIQSDGSTWWLQTSKVPLRNPKGEVIGVLGTYEDITERKRVEKELQQSEQMLKIVLDNFPGVVYWKDRDSVYLGANRESVRIAGFADSSEYCGKTDFDMPWGKTEADAYRADDRQVMESGRAKLHVNESQHRVGGTTRWLDTSKIPLRDAEENVIGVLGISTDITERKSAEDELRESEERFRTLSEASFEGIVIHVDGLIVDVNNAALEQMRHSRDEVIGRSILDFFAPESIETVGEVVWLPVAEAYGAHLLRKDGEIRIVQIKARIIEFNGQQARVATIMDVTEQVNDRKRIEELLQKKEEERIRLMTILDTLPVGVRVTDVGGRTELTNNRLKEIFQGQRANSFDEIEREEGLTDGFKLVRPEDTPLHEAITRGESVIGKVFDIQRRNGTNGTIMVSASQIRSETGVVIGGVATTQDITELRKVQRELARSNSDLQQFAYVASHDLQAPLRMISSYLQLLETRNKEILDQDSREYIAYAIDGAKSMNVLIKDILDYSRVNSQGKEFLPTDMDSVMMTVMRDLANIIEETSANVSYDRQPTIIADQTQMVQLLENLISNALKFHGEEPPIVQVSAIREVHYWQFAVKDNGIGLDPKYKSRIFEMFQRLHTRDEYKGTGIGLAICKRIVERHGGRIWVESDIGEGATFYFTIPIRPNFEKSSSST